MNIILTRNGNVKSVLRPGGRLVLQDYTAPAPILWQRRTYKYFYLQRKGNSFMV